MRMLDVARWPQYTKPSGMRAGDNMYADELKNSLPDKNHLIQLSCHGVPVGRIFRDIPSESRYCLRSYIGNAKTTVLFDEMQISGACDVILFNKAFEVGSICDLDALDMTMYEMDDEVTE